MEKNNLEKVENNKSEKRGSVVTIFLICIILILVAWIVYLLMQSNLNANESENNVFDSNQQDEESNLNQEEKSEEDLNGKEENINSNIEEKDNNINNEMVSEKEENDYTNNNDIENTVTEEKEEHQPQNEISVEQKVQTSYGEVVFNARKYLCARGWSGASNYIYYIHNNNLYLLKYDEEDELLAKGVVDIYYESDKGENIIVSILENAEIYNNNISYIKYVK